MTIIRARVNIETASRVYKPGEVIEETLSAQDFEFFNGKGFISVEKLEAAGEKPAEDSEDAVTFPEEDEEETGYKDENALKKLNKDEIVAYANGIGLCLDAALLKNDLIAAVLNYTEEKLEEQAEDGI